MSSKTNQSNTPIIQKRYLNDLIIQRGNLNARKRNRFNLFNLRITNRLKILLNIYFKPLILFKIIVTLLVSLLLILVFSSYIINKNFENKIITLSQNIPLELNTAVIVVTFEEYKDTVLFKNITDEVVSLYTAQKIRIVYIYILQTENNNTDLNEVINTFRGIPLDNLNINLNFKSEIEVCNNIKKERVFNKFLIISTSNTGFKINYLCNLKDLYIKSYKQNNLEFKSLNLLEAIKSIYEMEVANAKS